MCIDNDYNLFSIYHNPNNRSRHNGHHGFNNKGETRKLLAWIDEIKPDIIHMHNIVSIR